MPLTAVHAYMQLPAGVFAEQFEDRTDGRRLYVATLQPTPGTVFSVRPGDIRCGSPTAEPREDSQIRSPRDPEEAKRYRPCPVER